MKKILFVLALIIISTSCKYSSKEKVNLENQITSERNKADSLQRIIDTLRTKFIFDNLTILHIPNKNQPIKKVKNILVKFIL